MLPTEVYVSRCPVDTDKQWLITDSDSSDFSDCTFPVGFTFRIQYEDKKDMPDATEEHIAAPVHHEVADVPAEAHQEAAAAENEHQEVAHPATVATTEVPDAPNAAPDLSQIQGLAGGNPIVTVILALIVVGGGTAGWKFWNQKSKQNHELRLQELEVQKEMAGLNGVQPPPCQAASVKTQADIESIRGDLRSNSDAHKRLQEQIDDLSAQLKKFEKKASSMLSGDFDAEDVAERLEKLEKAKAKEDKEKKAAAKK